MPTFVCPKCGADSPTIETTTETLDGLSVTVTGHQRVTCAKCGEWLANTKVRWGEQSAIVTNALLGKPRRLAPGEITWLRKRLGWKGVELAARLGVTPSTVSRWETGAVPILPVADRALRAIVATKGQAPLFDADELAKIDDEDGSPLVLELELTEAGWMLARPAAPKAPRKAS